MNQYKFIVRKLVFVLALALLAASPILIHEYKMSVTTDPFILMAREIEAYEVSGVDVIDVDVPENSPELLRVLVQIEDWPKWSERKDRENFKRLVLQIARENGYESLAIHIGWGYPAKEIRVQGTVFCPELSIHVCEWQYPPGGPMRIPEEFIKWPGIGKP